MSNILNKEININLVLLESITNKGKLYTDLSLTNEFNFNFENSPVLYSDLEGTLYSDLEGRAYALMESKGATPILNYKAVM